jgi:hypothetical protein
MKSPRALAPWSSGKPPTAARRTIRGWGCQGIRLIEISVPDVKSKKFAAEALRQAGLVGKSTEEVEIQSFIDSVFVWPDDAYSQ